jgi:hypothetical protein
MVLTEENKIAVRKGLRTLGALADEAENAGMFDGLAAAKALAREQIKFNTVIGEILCS